MRAQSATPAAEAATGLLAQATVEGLDGLSPWLGRLTLGPGGVVPDRVLAGPVLLYVESGLLSVTSDTPLQGMIGGERIDDMQNTNQYVCPCQLHQGEDGWSGSLSLAVGHSTLAPAGATQGLANHGTVPVSVLMLTVGAALPADGQEGVSVTNLAATGEGGLAGGGAHTLTIERVTIAGGESVTGDSTSSLELGAVEAGAVEATFDADDVQTYEAGDRYTFAGGTVTWAAGDEPVTILRAIITPA